MEIINSQNRLGAINKAAKTIKKGGLVVFPSDTVYGLFVDATNQKAVDKLLAFKNRWSGKAISVAVSDKKMAEEYVEISETANNVIDNLLPGPFTVIAKGKHKVAKGVEAANGSLGIRIPDFKPITDLVLKVGGPVTATSANLSGRTPHYSIKSLLNTLSKSKREMLDLVVDWGRLPKNLPSTVIEAIESEIKVLRRGDLLTGDSKSLVSKSEEETNKIAGFLLKRGLDKFGDKKKAMVFLLSGDLGGGKTVFSRAIGKLLGVKERITSPTFTIFNEYLAGYQITDDKQKIKKFLHFDLYRIKQEEELEEIKFQKQFQEQTLACVEWPENMGKKALERLEKKANCIQVLFEYLDENSRKISYKI
jgi:L-threonylcarbamoyladenylate synthase